MRIYRYVGSFVLGAALIAPAGMVGGTNFQDDHHQDNKQQNRDDKNQKRYYDKSHKDYHNWDDRENRSYSRNTGIGVTTIRMTTGTRTSSTRT